LGCLEHLLIFDHSDHFLKPSNGWLVSVKILFFKNKRMATTPLPIEDSGSEVSDQTSVYDEDDFRNHFVIRMTPQEKYSLDDVKLFLQQAFQEDSWVAAREIVPKEHFHIVLETSLEIKEVKTNILTFLHMYWPDGQRPRGWGNAQYNCQVVNELLEEEVVIYRTKFRKAIAYALKDREEYVFNEIDQEFIDECIALSFQKKKSD